MGFWRAQTLAEAWKERLQDPWTHKILASSGSEQDLEDEPQPPAQVQLLCTFPPRGCHDFHSLVPAAAAVLQAMQHRQGMHPSHTVSHPACVL